MFRLLFILGCFLNCFTTVVAQDFLAGQIRVEQLSGLTIKVHFDLLVEIHQTVDYLPVCWGDGNCDNLPLVSVEDLPAFNAKYHHFNAFYTYSEQGTYAISTDICCWWEDLANLPNAGDAPFNLEASFSFVDEINGTYNSTPVFDLLPYAQANFNEALSYPANIYDAEGDSISVKIEAIEAVPIAGYVLPTAIFANPNNFFSMVENSGNLLWLTPPPFENKYVLCLQLSEYRNETLVSLSQQYIYFVIKEAPNSLITNNSESQINLFPNPSQARFFLAMPTTMQNNIESVSIYNQQGKLISSHLYLEEGYPITALSSGIYHVQLTLKEGSPINKFFVKI